MAESAVYRSLIYETNSFKTIFKWNIAHQSPRKPLFYLIIPQSPSEDHLVYQYMVFFHQSHTHRTPMCKVFLCLRLPESSIFRQILEQSSRIQGHQKQFQGLHPYNYVQKCKISAPVLCPKPTQVKEHHIFNLLQWMHPFECMHLINMVLEGILKLQPIYTFLSHQLRDGLFSHLSSSSAQLSIII